MTTHQERPFGVWTASALVVGGMIGAGIFVIPTELAPYGATVPFAWAMAIGGALVLALVLCRLSAARPEATGSVAIIGDILGPLAGVLIGWSYWVAICSANAIIALTAVRYAGYLAPSLVASELSTAFAATTLVWALTALNLGGARGAGRFQVLTTLLKLLPLIAVVLILAGLVAFSPAQFSAHPRAEFDSGQLLSVATIAFFPMVGFEAASLAAGRVRNPARNVLRATIIGTAFTGLLYVIISSGIIFAMPSDVLTASSAPIALFVGQFWGDIAGLVVAIFAAVSAIGCLNGWVLMQGEVPLGMARAGLLHPVIAHTNGRDVGSFAVLGSSMLITLMILSGALPGMTGFLTFMLQLTTAATVWLYIGGCLAALKIGIVRIPAAIGLLVGGAILWGVGLEPLLLSLALMATAVPLYLLRGRPSAKQAA